MFVYSTWSSITIFKVHFALIFPRQQKCLQQLEIARSKISFKDVWSLFLHIVSGVCKLGAILIVEIILSINYEGCVTPAA